MSDKKMQTAKCEHCVDTEWISTRRPLEGGIGGAALCTLMFGMIAAVLCGILGLVCGPLAPTGRLEAAKFCAILGAGVGLMLGTFFIVRNGIIGVYLYYAVHRDGLVHVTRELPSHEVAERVFRIAWGGWHKKGAVLTWYASQTQHTVTGEWRTGTAWIPEAAWSPLGGVVIRLRDKLSDATPYLSMPDLLAITFSCITLREYLDLVKQIIEHLTTRSLDLIEELLASRDRSKSPHAQHARERLAAMLRTIPNRDLAARMNAALDALAEKYRPRPRPAPDAPADDSSPPPQAA